MKKVVIADDNEIILKQLASNLMLNDEIRVVGTARNGEEELECIRDFKPDVVVTDLQMPRKTGIEVIEQVEDHFDSQPEFIIITGDMSPQIIQKLHKLSIKQVLQKPLNMQELIKGILY